MPHSLIITPYFYCCETKPSEFRLVFWLLCDCHGQSVGTYSNKVLGILQYSICVFKMKNGWRYKIDLTVHIIQFTSSFEMTPSETFTPSNPSPYYPAAEALLDRIQLLIDLGQDLATDTYQEVAQLSDGSTIASYDVAGNNIYIIYILHCN